MIIREITVGRAEKVNLGNFESMEFSVFLKAEIEHSENVEQCYHQIYEKAKELIQETKKLENIRKQTVNVVKVQKEITVNHDKQQPEQPTKDDEDTDAFKDRRNRPLDELIAEFELSNEKTSEKYIGLLRWRDKISYTEYTKLIRWLRGNGQ